MSFKIEDDNVLVNYNKIWNTIKNILDIEFHSKPVYNEKYIKAKVNTFNEVVNKVFSQSETSKENIHYICIAQYTLILS